MSGKTHVSMISNPNAALLAGASTRRQVMRGLAVALSGLAASPQIFAITQQQGMKETPATEANKTRTSLHEEILYKASPQRIYDALLDAKQFAAFTSMPADIDSKAGGAFTLFGGMIVGRIVEIVPNQRIVEAWRPTHWDPGYYSVVKFELKAQGADTTLILDHTGFPEGDYDSLSSGWKSHYIEPLKKYLV
ncbi:MAG: SRPBCC family protein [Candidatus Acidiferrales bacterium]